VIRNFRNLANLDVSLPKGFCCLIGPNGTGKSNFIRAIRLCLDRDFGPQRRLADEDFYNRQGPPHATHVLASVELSEISTNEEKAFCLEALLPTDTTRARITYRFRPNKKVRDQIADGTKDVNNLSLSDYEYQLVASGDKDPVDCTWDDEDFGTGFSTANLQRFFLAALPALRDAPRDMANQRLSPLQRLVDQVSASQSDKDSLVFEIHEANDRLRKHPIVQTLEATIQKRYNDTFGPSNRDVHTLAINDPTYDNIVRSLALLVSRTGLESIDLERNSDGYNNCNATHKRNNRLDWA
jgi:predicted ATP-dependent endonuclease of OLD family